ncbi:MAG TPA: ABC transporter ATP-binding protein [archaeon]|nr:ABC transporter ATP-binding protein [archaeon]
MSEAIIKLIDVWKRLGSQEVLKGLDLDVPRGETLVIMGRSGAGKSVILKHMIGLMSPDKGNVFFDGQSLERLSRAELNEVHKRFGMLFQSSALFDSMTVGENVSIGLRHHTNLTEEEIRGVVAKKLEAVGLPGLENKMPSELSGGMRKRVGLARAISMDPEVILYDEPTTGLDPIMADAINELILETRNHVGATSVVVTHDVNSALKVGTLISLLDDGRIIFTGKPQELKETDNPYVKQFLEGRATGPLKG